VCGVGSTQSFSLLFEKSTLFIVILIIIFGIIPLADGITPLKFHQHYHGFIEAIVVGSSISNIPTLHTNKFMSGRSKEESTIWVPVEKIQLRVDSILCSESISGSTADIIKKGSLILVTNPWLDMKAPFKPGDRILAGIQLVSSSESFDPLGRDNEWWFYSGEEKISISPPRRPFTYLKVLE
jgi:hypothetical protein